MEAIIVRIYPRSVDLLRVLNILQNQGLKVLVHSSSDQGEGYEELIIYREEPKTR